MSNFEADARADTQIVFDLTYTNENNSLSISQDTSLNFIEQTRKINLFATVVIILIGLVGNCLTIFVFCQKRFRVNSSNVYLLFLAITDSIFLIVHIFEDSIREYEEIYLFKQPVNVNSFVSKLNITDSANSLCLLISFLRYFLRFTSAYVIVAFTIQRLLLVYTPFSDKFKSKKSAWLIIITILCMSLFLNLWVPFLFELQLNDEDNKHRCALVKQFESEYFIITLVYISLVMLVPILTVFICNFLIIHKIKKENLNRSKLRVINAKAQQANEIMRREQLKQLRTKNETNFKLRVYYMPSSQAANNVKTSNWSANKRLEDSNKLATTLVLISLSYAIFNLPYLIVWFLFFYQTSFNDIEDSTRNYLFGILQISKIFFVLNYGLKFYLYCATGSVFRNQLKYSSEFFRSSFIAIRLNSYLFIFYFLIYFKVILRNQNNLARHNWNFTLRLSNEFKFNESD